MKRSRISESTIKQLEKKQQGKCNRCGTPLEKGKFNVDHIIPLSRKGADLFSNLQIICLRCHKRKSVQEGFILESNNILKREFLIACNYCGKVIEGMNEKQVDYLLKQHILSKHPDKLNFEKIEA